MTTKTVEENGLRVSLNRKENGLVVSSDNWNLLRPFMEKEKELKQKALEPLQSLTKEELAHKLSLHKQQSETVEEKVLKAMLELIKEGTQIQLIQDELKTLDDAEKAKKYVQKNQSVFNQVVETKDKEGLKSVRLHNNVYILSLEASNPSYRKNYQVTFSLQLNPYFFPQSKYGYTLELVESNSHKEAEQTEKYIENKLKKLAHLFQLENAVLKEHLDKFDIPERFIKEVGIQVFDSKEDMVKTSKEQAKQEA